MFEDEQRGLKLGNKEDSNNRGQLRKAPERESEQVIEYEGRQADIVAIRDLEETRKLQRALEAEEKYRKQFEEALDAIFIADAKTGIIIDCNHAASEIVDRKKSELVGKHQRILHPPQETEGGFSRTFKQHLKEKEGQVLETQIITKKGEIKDVAIKASVFQIKGTKVIQEIFRDVTEQKKVEERVRESEEKYRNLFQNARDVIVTFDLKGNVTSINRAITEYRFKEDELIGRNMLEFVPQKYRAKLIEEIAKVAQGKPIEGEIEIITPSGKKTAEYRSNPMRHQNEVIGIHTILRDVTDRKFFERSLSALNVYGQNLNTAESLEKIYHVTLMAMKKTLGFEYASILIVKGKMLRLVSHYGYAKQFSINLPLDGEKGVTVKAVRTGKSVFVPDVTKEKSYVLGKPSMLSELAVPIKVGEEALGVLNVESKRPAAFNEDDKKLLEILASHAATAIGNLKRQKLLKELSNKIKNLMKSTTEIMHVENMNQRLKVIAKAIRKFGWRRVVISLRDENLIGIDLVTSGLEKEELKLLIERKAPGYVWQKRLGPIFQRFKIGEFYYLPWTDSWIRENVHGVPSEANLKEATTYAGVPSKLSPKEMIDWHPQDMLYAPLRTPEGKIVGILSMDDPMDGRKPTREALTPLELFLHQAAIVIENAQLIQNLRKARRQLATYTEQLEQKVDERTRELKKSQEQLLKTQRLAVIGELAGMVGHDLRNPLTSINGAAYYLKKRLCPTIYRKAKEMLDLIEKNIEYSNKIINDLLDYSKEIKLDLTNCKPRLIVKEALSLVDIPENIRVIDLTKDKPKIRVDVQKMKRAFINIIKNAIDAMPEGGELTIKSKKLNDNVEFVFSDMGVGMSKKIIEQLWTPLFTTKAKGMGFGLPICKRVIEAHEGTISAESSFGKGTTFTVTIPTKLKTKGGEKIWIEMPESSLLMMTKT